MMKLCHTHSWELVRRVGIAVLLLQMKKTDPWIVVGCTWHNGHQDRIESTNKYTYMYCPNCGKTTVCGISFKKTSLSIKEPPLAVLFSGIIR